MVKFFNESIPSKYLVVIRIVIGSWLLVDCVSLVFDTWTQQAYIDAIYHFSYPGLDFIQPLSGNGMRYLYILLSFLALLILLGYWYRVATVLFFMLFTYGFLCSQVYYLNKFYLFVILSFWLIFIPAHRSFSLDVKWRKVKEIKQAPYWTLGIFKIHLIIIYTFAGIAKMYPEWINGQTTSMLFSGTVLDDVFDKETYKVIAIMIAYISLVFDSTICIWLSIKKTRFVSHLLQIIFHLLNLILLGIGSLSFYMILLTLLCFPTDKIEQWLSNKKEQESTIQVPKLTQVVLGIYIFIQIIVPIRPFLIDKDVSWTEAGHRFSWRLMSRTKRYRVQYVKIVDQETGKVSLFDYKSKLQNRQRSKIFKEGDLLVALAHELSEEYKKKTGHEAAMYAKIYVSLNGKPFKLYVDEKIDLAKVERHWLYEEVVLQQKK